jgi:hypothetical protein
MAGKKGMFKQYQARVCDICGIKYIPLAGNQRHCWECRPTVIHLRYLQAKLNHLQTKKLERVGQNVGAI